MDATSVAKLFDRAAYFSRSISTLAGGGFSWSHTFPDGETHRYVLNGLKSPDEVEHEVLTLALWLWSLKDYLKNRAQSLGKKGQDVETYATNDPFLPLCADVANCAKHGQLTKSSRSGYWPHLGKIAYDIPQQAMRTITFSPFQVEADVSRPDLVTVELPILDPAGLRIGDVFEVVEGALTSWERFNKDLEEAP